MIISKWTLNKPKSETVKSTTKKHWFQSNDTLFSDPVGWEWSWLPIKHHARHDNQGHFSRSFPSKMTHSGVKQQAGEPFRLFRCYEFPPWRHSEIDLWLTMWSRSLPGYESNIKIEMWGWRMHPGSFFGQADPKVFHTLGIQYCIMQHRSVMAER